MSRLRRSLAAVIGTAVLVAGTSSLASEGVGDMHTNGVQGWSVGRLPPAGLYGLVYTNSYIADRPKDQPVRFKMCAESVTPRQLYVTPIHVLGACWAVQALLPFVNSRVRLNAVHSERIGQADLTVLPFLFDWSVGKWLDVAVSLDVVAPEGDYRASRAPNLGKNHWVLRPALATTWRPRARKVSGELGYEVNFRHEATGEGLGGIAHIASAIGYLPNAKLAIRLGGYALQQLTRDETPGSLIPYGRMKDRVFALGPTAQVAARNRPEGKAGGLTLILPFRRAA